MDVVSIVELVNQHNIVLIPFGGGTSVSGAVSCPVNEKRCIVSVDTSQMVIFIIFNINIYTSICIESMLRNSNHVFFL